MIQLQKLTPQDFDTLISWVDTAELLMQFAGPGFTFPLTHQQITSSVNDPHRLAFKVIETTTDEMIGHAEIYLKEKSACLGRIIIGDKDRRGKGIGQEIMKQLLEYSFSKLNQTKVELNVFDWNANAIKCYEKFGFEIERGKERETKMNDEIWTVVNMTLEKVKWEDIKKNGR
ncbi:MAG: GNAT family protein [Bacteroidota bacterium]